MKEVLKDSPQVRKLISNFQVTGPQSIKFIKKQTKPQNKMNFPTMADTPSSTGIRNISIDFLPNLPKNTKSSINLKRAFSKTKMPKKPPLLGTRAIEKTLREDEKVFTELILNRENGPGIEDHEHFAVLKEQSHM